MKDRLIEVIINILAVLLFLPALILIGVWGLICIVGFAAILPIMPVYYIITGRNMLDTADYLLAEPWYQFCELYGIG